MRPCQLPFLNSTEKINRFMLDIKEKIKFRESSQFKIRRTCRKAEGSQIDEKIVGLETHSIVADCR